MTRTKGIEQPQDAISIPITEADPESLRINLIKNIEKWIDFFSERRITTPALSEANSRFTNNPEKEDGPNLPTLLSLDSRLAQDHLSTLILGANITSDRLRHSLSRIPNLINEGKIKSGVTEDFKQLLTYLLKALEIPIVRYEDEEESEALIRLDNINDMVYEALDKIRGNKTSNDPLFHQPNIDHFREVIKRHLKKEEKEARLIAIFEETMKKIMSIYNAREFFTDDYLQQIANLIIPLPEIVQKQIFIELRKNQVEKNIISQIRNRIPIALYKQGMTRHQIERELLDPERRKN